MLVSREFQAWGKEVMAEKLFIDQEWLVERGCNLEVSPGSCTRL